MEVEMQRPSPPPTQERTTNKHLMTSFQILNYAALLLGGVVGPLTIRIYYVHGGQRKWLTSWLQTAACPFTLIPLAISYAHRCRRRCLAADRPPPKFWLSTTPVFLAGAVLGLLMGLDDFLYSYAAAYLPVSTSSIIISTQLAFTAVFSFLIVRQRFTAFSVNALVLLITGSVLLGLGANGDRPEGVSKGQYLLGFFLLLGAAALYGLVLPLIELTYNKAHVVCYTVAMEVQLLIGVFATAFCTVGMIVNHDFQAIKREAQEFGLGELKYYMVLIWFCISCEIFFIGMVGTIFYGSALLSGIIFALCIPLTEVFAVIFLHEPFSGQKGVSVVLSLWGFASYFYGEYQESSKKKPIVVEPMLDDPIN